LIHSRYQGVCHFSAHTVCTKLVQSRYLEFNKRFCSYSLFQNHFIHDIWEYAIFLLLHFVPNLFSQGILSIINVLASQFVSKWIHSRYQGVCNFSAPTVCTNLVQSRYFEYNKRIGSYSLFQNGFIHDIREDATFLLLQFVPILFSRGILSIIKDLDPTICFKSDSFTISGSMQLFCSYSLYQSCSVEVF